MKAIKDIILIIFLMLSFKLSGQKLTGGDAIDAYINGLKEKYPILELSKAEMYADFDTLVSIMERCNPQYLVRKKVTSYDMIAEMKARRPQVENCNKTSEFIKLLDNVLSLSLDEHCVFARSVWFYKRNIYKKDIKINKIKEKDFGINFNYEAILDSCYQPDINLIYLNGQYFLKNTTTFFNGNDTITISSGTEIFSFNNQNIVSYLNSLKRRGSRWNFNEKKHYNSELPINDTENNIVFNINNVKKNVLFNKFIQQERKRNEFQLNWFAADSVLYLKIPAMSYYPKIMQQFKENILEYKSKPVKSVIIDIRGNGGGNDKVWLELLSVISKKSIEYQYCHIYNDDKDVFKRYSPKTKKRIKYDFVDFFYQFRVFEEEKYTIKSSSKNLGYDGIIYLLVDEDIYSSSLAFASLSTKTNQIKTIGMYTGKIGGEGATPSVFILPNSRLIFIMELILDATNVSKAEDFYHDHVDYPVIPSINYYKYWYAPNKPYEIDEEAMYEHDEVFKKALELSIYFKRFIR